MTVVLSLFPGIGVLDRAFEEEGFCVVRGPDVLWGGNVRAFHPPAGVFGGIIGGPPCQDFSPLKYLLEAQGRKPKHGNLIPEYERCVLEAEPEWFLMENVPPAPLPAVPGYQVKAILLNNRWVGGVQHRLRRFSFGSKDGRELLFGDELVVFEASEWDWLVTSDPRTVPVKMGGNGKVKTTVTAGSGPAPGQRGRAPTVIQSGVDNSPQAKGRVPATVTGGHGPLPYNTVTSSDGGPSVRMARYKLSEMLELQGLPADFCDEMPFTMAGKRKAIGNAVPMDMGRAIARAVKRATA